MSLKINKQLLFICAVLLAIIIIPASFAGDVDDNHTLTADVAPDTGAADESIIYVSPDASDDGTGTNDNPYTLSKAIENYNSTKNSYIFVKNGEYTFTNKTIINKNMSIIGESKDGVILNGNYQSAVFKISGDSNPSSVVLTNLTFKNGNLTEIGYYDPLGTLQITYAKSVVINDCTFANNLYGAIYSDQTFTECTISIAGSTFTSNQVIKSSSGNGGALYVSGGKTTVNIVNSTFEDNFANSTYSESFAAYGGAIYGAGNFQLMTIDGCVFKNNRAKTGAAIGAYCGGNITIKNSKFIENIASKEDGSVIYDKQSNSAWLTLSVKNNTFTDNTGSDIVIEEKVNLIDLDLNTQISGTNVGSESYYSRVYVGEELYYTVTLTDNDGNPIKGQKISINFTNYFKTIEKTEYTDVNGQVVIDLSGFDAGRYDVVARFDGDGEWNAAETLNKVLIATHYDYQIIFDPDTVEITEGQAYLINGTVVDEYLEPTRNFNGIAFHIEYVYYNGRTHSIWGGHFINGSTVQYDLNVPNLITREAPYTIVFTTEYDGYYYDSFSGNVTVYVKGQIPDNFDKNLEIIYVSTNGSDTDGDGSQANPVASVQTALLMNRALGGGKTIMVDEGTYEISNFHILEDVKIIGTKGKTVFSQPYGNQGMFKMDYNESNITFRDIIFRNGYTTPQPYSLLTIYGANIYVYIDGCEFTNNTGLEGSSIAVSHKAYAYINNSKFYNNRAILITSEGGAIEVFDAYASITNCEFINNTACDGGAIYTNYASSVDIVNSTFINNTAIKTTLEVGGGGAIFARGQLNIYNSTFINNTADLYGGAILVWAGKDSNINIQRSYFEGNDAGKELTNNPTGTGIHVYTSYYFDFNVEYSVFIDQTVLNTCELEYSNITAENNYWGSGSSTNIAHNSSAIIVVESETTPVYAGNTVKLNVQFKGKNADGIYTLDKSVHDYTVSLTNTIEGNTIEDSEVIISDNIAQTNYNAEKSGSENIIVGGANNKFTVFESPKENINAEITIIADENTVITVKVPENIENNITIDVNGSIYSRAAENGIVKLTVPTTPGTYPVYVSYAGDDNYNDFNKSASFTVSKYASSVKILVDNIYNGDNVYINVTVSPQTTGTVTIMVDAKKFTKTLENGSCVFNISGLYIKDPYADDMQVYNVEATFNGNSLYAESTDSTTFNVTKRPVEPVVPEKEKGYATFYITPGANSQIMVRVPYNLENNVTVYVDSKKYSLAENEGRIYLTIPTDAEGTHSVLVIYEGDDKVTEFTGSTTFKVDDYTWFIGDNKYRSIYDAVAAAGDGDVIKGSPGVYEIYQTIDVGHRYMPIEPWEVNKTITITSLTDEPITFKGDSRRIFFVDIGSDLTLKNIIFTGTKLSITDGAAVENMYGSNLTIENCTFKDLNASRGGAVFVWGNTLIKNSKFINNHATLGGAIFVLGSLTATGGSFVLDNVEFIENTASSFGGAIYFDGSSNFPGFIYNSEFIDNTGNWRGGAIYASYANLTIDNTLFKGNKAISEDYEVEVQENVTYGPCGCIIDTSNAVTRNQTVHIDALGGAMYVSNYANAFISNSQFDDNSAEFGGALGLSNSITYIISNVSGTNPNGIKTATIHWTTLDNCSFTQNKAEYSGGAIFIGYSGVPYVNITDSTFDANTAEDSAAIENDFGILKINGSEFKNHISEQGSAITAYGTEVYTFTGTERYDATTTIENSVFSDNKVDCDIYQANAYSILLLNNTKFENDDCILVNRGQANLTNIVEINSQQHNDSIINYGVLSLENYTFIKGNASKKATSLTAKKISVTYNSGKYLVVTLKDADGNVISNATVSIKLYGVTYNKITNKNGQAKLKIKLVPGTYTAKIAFNGNDDYLNATGIKANVVVKKAASKLTAKNKKFKAKTKTKKYTITLKANGKAVKKVKLTLKIKGKKYTAKTNAKGKATFKIKKLTKKGKFKATVSFKGNKLYKAVSKKVKITIK